MRSTMLAFLHANAVFPDDLILRISGKKPVSTGFAVADEGEVFPVSMTATKGDVVDTITKSQEVFKDKKRFYAFQFVDKADEFNEDTDQQPFELLAEGDGKGKKHHLMAFAEGTFPTYATKASGASPESDFVTYFVLDLVDDLWAQAKQNISTFMQLLDTDECRAKIKEACQPDGTVMFIPCEGDPLAISGGKFSTPLEFSWGICTQSALGYTEGKPKEEKTEEPRALSPRERRDQQKKLAEQPTDTPAKKEEAPAGGTAVDLGPYFIKSKGQFYCRPEAKNGLDAAKRMWTTNCLMPHPKEPAAIMAGFPIDQMKPGSSMAQLWTKLTGGTAMGEALATAKPKPAVASTEADKKVTTEELMLVSADHRKLIFDDIQAGKLVPDADHVASTADTYKKFSEQMGLPWATICQWPLKAIANIPKQALLSLLNEFRMRDIKQNPTLLKKVTAEDKKEEVAPITPKTPAEATPPAAPKPLTRREQIALMQKAG